MQMALSLTILPRFIVILFLGILIPNCPARLVHIISSICELLFRVEYEWKNIYASFEFRYLILYRSLLLYIYNLTSVDKVNKKYNTIQYNTLRNLYRHN